MEEWTDDAGQVYDPHSKQGILTASHMQKQISNQRSTSYCAKNKVCWTGRHSLITYLPAPL